MPPRAAVSAAEVAAAADLLLLAIIIRALARGVAATMRRISAALPLARLQLRPLALGTALEGRGGVTGSARLRRELSRGAADCGRAALLRLWTKAAAGPAPVQRGVKVPKPSAPSVNLLLLPPPRPPPPPPPHPPSPPRPGVVALLLPPPQKAGGGCSRLYPSTAARA